MTTTPGQVPGTAPDDVTGPARSARNRPTVAVLGLGAMGLPMATHLARSFEVRGFDVAPARRELAQDAGAHAAFSAAEACAGADVALVSVRDGAQLAAVLFDDDGAARALAPGSVVVVTSTVGEAAVTSAAVRLAERGIAAVDAPVSGGPVRAGAGELLVMVGAPREAVDAARPVLDAIAGRLHVVGELVGQGQQLKTVNQLLCGIHTAAAAEALALAHRLGLDLDQVVEVLGEGAAASFLLADRGPRSAQQLRGEEPLLRSRLDLIAKDIRIVAELAGRLSLATPTAAGADQLYRLGEAAGLGAHDDSIIATTLAPEE